MDNEDPGRPVEDQIAYYRARAPEYDATSLKGQALDSGEDQEWLDEQDEALRALGDFAPTGQVLEIAAGTGQWTGHLLRWADSHTNQRELWSNLPALKARMFILEGEHGDDALRRFVGAASSQEGERLSAIMRVVGLEDPPMTGVNAARALGVSGLRVTQLTRNMRVRIEQSTPPAGVWMPQEDARSKLAGIAQISTESSP